MNTANQKNKLITTVILILIFAFCWQLFLTLGIDFFWEDFDIFHVYWEKSAEFQQFKDTYLPESIPASRFTLTLGIGKEFFKQFLVPRRLFQIGFGAYSLDDRPYQFLTWDLLKIHFGNSVILYRIFKAAIFAINALLIFLIIRRASLLLAFFGVLLYITSSEVWLSTLFISHLGLLAQCGTIASVMIFIKLTEKKSVRCRDVWTYYFFILLASNFAVLSTGDSRYLAIILFLTLLFFRIKNILIHLIPISILFLLEFPILGYFKKIFIDWSFSPINLASHNSTSTSWLSSLLMASRHRQFLINAVGNNLFIILAVCLSLHFVYVLFSLFFSFFHKNKDVPKDLNIKTALLKERLFLFALWFLATLTMTIRAYSLRYGVDPICFLLYNLAYFIAPSIIFVCYYISLISNTRKRFFNVFFITICSCLLAAQVYSNVIRLGAFRDRCDDQFCIWQNTKKYVDNKSENALVLAFNKVPYKPFRFIDSNNKISNTIDSCEKSQFCDLNFIESKFKSQGYEDVFVVGRDEMKFRGESESVLLHQEKIINGDCGDLYSRLTHNNRHKSEYEIHVYHFKIKN